MRDFQKEAKELQPKFAKNLVKYWDEAMQLCLDYDAETGDLGIVDEDYMNEMVEEQAKKWGWQRVACFLQGVQCNLIQEFYRIDGYGNAETITYNTLECWLDDIANDRM